MKHTVTIIIFLLLTAIPAHPQPKTETRAVWLTVNHNLDWPKAPAYGKQDIENNRKALDDILDKLKSANINLVFFQVRIRGSLVYNSDIEPYTELIKSRRCTEHFDALRYAVEACHERGMEFHAWFNVFPLGRSPIALKENSFFKSIAVKFKNHWYINPGNPDASDYLISIVKEITSGYDVDGIHFDYIRYPNNSEKFPDANEYRLYGNGKSKSEWRRENINRFVYSVYDTIKKIKPWVAVSSSVAGMYDRLPGIDRKHWTAYNSVFQDPVDWVVKGKHDFIVPMLYNRDDLFFPFLDDWVRRCGRDKVVPGLGLYMMNEAGWTADVITGQINYLRKNNINGCAMFRVKNLTENEPFFNRLASEYFLYPSLLPIFTNVVGERPPQPEDFHAERHGDDLHLSWSEPEGSENIQYNIYRSLTVPVDADNPENLIAVGLVGAGCRIPVDDSEEVAYYYAVTAFDRRHSESKVSNTVLFVSSRFEK
jgi:uncharacterized lipoprotein YddW (UPF0748 family)